VLACHKPVTAHVDRSGRWLGARMRQYGKQTTFVLVPAETRRPVPAVAAPGARRAATVRQSGQLPRTARRVLCGRLWPTVANSRWPMPGRQIESERDKGIYRLHALGSRLRASRGPGCSRP